MANGLCTNWTAGDDTPRVTAGGSGGGGSEGAMNRAGSWANNVPPISAIADKRPWWRRLSG